MTSYDDSDDSGKLPISQRRLSRTSIAALRQYERQGALNSHERRHLRMLMRYYASPEECVRIMELYASPEMERSA